METTRDGIRRLIVLFEQQKNWDNEKAESSKGKGWIHPRDFHSGSAVAMGAARSLLLDLLENTEEGSGQ